MLGKLFWKVSTGMVFAPGYTAMVIMRKDFGRDLFTLMFVFICAILCGMMKTPFYIFATVDGKMELLALYIAVTNCLLLYAWIQCWKRRVGNSEDSARFYGRTRFRWFWSKIPFSSNGKLLQVGYEPLLVFIIGTLLLYVENALGRWVQMSAIMLSISSAMYYHKQAKLCQQIDDMNAVAREAAGATAL